MAKQVINIGTRPNSKDGDAIRDAFNKVNQNFNELYDQVSSIEISEVNWDIVTNKPTIPTDISQLTDNLGLLIDSFDGGTASSAYDEEETIDGGAA
jgi:DUF438 domain-containing protein